MNISRCKNTYFKNKTAENWEKYGKLRNECVSLTKKVKREDSQDLNINFINDNKTFWKTVKPFLCNKGNTNQKKIILVENDEIIRDDNENADIMNEYFVNVTKSLDIPEFKIGRLPTNTDIVYIVTIRHILFN